MFGLFGKKLGTYTNASDTATEPGQRFYMDCGFVGGPETAKPANTRTSTAVNKLTEDKYDAKPSEPHRNTKTNTSVTYTPTSNANSTPLQISPFITSTDGYLSVPPTRQELGMAILHPRGPWQRTCQLHGLLSPCTQQRLRPGGHRSKIIIPEWSGRMHTPHAVQLQAHNDA